MRRFALLLFFVGCCLPTFGFAQESPETWATDPSHIPLNWEVTSTVPDVSIEEARLVSKTLNLRFHVYRQIDDSYLVRLMDNRCLWDLYQNSRKGTEKDCETESYRVLVPVGFKQIPWAEELLPEKIIRLERVVTFHSSSLLEFAVFETRPKNADKSRKMTERRACFMTSHMTPASKALMSYLCRNGSQQFTLPNGDPVCVSLALCHEEIPKPEN